MIEAANHSGGDAIFELFDVSSGQDVNPIYRGGKVLPPASVGQTGHKSEPDAVVDPKSVFVIHGRDTKNVDAMYIFLREVGLRPLEWSEVVKTLGNPNPPVWEVVQKGIASSQATLVLLTCDEEVRLRSKLNNGITEPFSFQPRPNVLIEAGFAFGLRPRNTVFVQIGPLRTFSDLEGFHILRFDGNSGKRQELAERLILAGCDASMEGTRWHTAGDFHT